MEFLKYKALEYGFALIVAPAAYMLVQHLKKYVEWVNALSPWKKRAFVVVTVTVLTILGQAIGVDFGVTESTFELAANIDQESIKIALGSAFAMAIHALKKADEARKNKRS